MKTNKLNWSSTFCYIAHARILFHMEGWKDRQIMSNVIVADRLLTGETTNNGSGIKREKRYLYATLKMFLLPSPIHGIINKYLIA